MDAEITSLLAYRMRRLVSQYGDSQELAQAMRTLLQGERNVQALRCGGAAAGDAEPMFGQKLQVLSGR
jgi:hypothetical protein